MPRITRIGDICDHPAVIITGDASVLVEGPPSSRIGDIGICFKHGIQPIVTGCPNGLTQSTNYSRIGSILACGAVLITGASKSEIS